MNGPMSGVIMLAAITEPNPQGEPRCRVVRLVVHRKSK